MADSKKKSTFNVVIPKSQIDFFMNPHSLFQESPMELTILTTAISTAMYPIFNYIRATSADFTQDIYKLENTVTKGKLAAGELTLRERKEFTAKYFAEEENFFDTPKEIYDEFKKLPTEFLLQKDVLPLMRRELFTHIGIDSINFETPEAVVSLRAVTTQTVLNLIDIMQEKPELVQPSKTFEGGLREFDASMEKVGSK